MEWLHLSGVSIIQTLQARFQVYSEWMLVASHLGDPRNAFLIYFPLAFICRPSVGVKAIWVAAIAEFINAILKWLLYGQRPYWWVHETPLYGGSPPVLHQYPYTCETGPGSPSGHVMVTAAVLHTMTKALVQHRLKSSPHRVLYTLLSWTCFTLFMAVIALSRCFIATHFPHQVAAGSVAGIWLSLACDRLPVGVFSLRHHIIGCCVMIASSVTVAWCMMSLGLDPNWSLRVAPKWCQKAEWIHLNTTPYNSIVRDAAAIMGIGLGLKMMNAKRRYSQPTRYMDGHWLVTVAGLVLSFLLTQGSEYINIAQDSPLVFYIISAVKNAGLPVLIVYVIPGFLTWALPEYVKGNKGRPSNLKGH